MPAGPDCKILTVEDPIECYFPWMVQTQINEKEGISFATAVRSFLRSDPDVILIGELRDNNVLNLCCQAALTGHLVLTTLHADDAAKALCRMVEMGLPPPSW
jgi:type IV pilus assembly protein PilB